MFIKSFRSQFRAMINQPGFRICFITVLLCGMINSAYWLFSNPDVPVDGLVDQTQAFLLADGAPREMIFFVISLFVLSFPYSFSEIKNRRLRMQSLQPVQEERMSYYLAGAAVAFCGTFLAFCLPLLMELCVNCIFFPTNGSMASQLTIYDPNGGGVLTGVSMDATSIANVGISVIPIALYITHPVLYDAIYSILYAIFMGFASIFTYAVSLYFRRNIYLFFFMYVFHYVLTWLGKLNVTEPEITVDFFQYFLVGNVGGLSKTYFVLLSAGILTTSFFLILYKTKMKHINVIEKIMNQFRIRGDK